MKITLLLVALFGFTALAPAADKKDDKPDRKNKKEKKEEKKEEVIHQMILQKRKRKVEAVERLEVKARDKKSLMISLDPILVQEGEKEEGEEKQERRQWAARGAGRWRATERAVLRSRP